MRIEARQKYSAYLAAIAQLSGVSDATKTFNVDPSVQQTLETRMQESSDFLQRINIVPVTEQIGDKVGMVVGGPIASRTNTTNTDRSPRNVLTLDDKGYRCVQTDFDTYVPYATLDAWAKFNDFQARLRDLILKRQALDRIMIGWNGTSVAAQTDLAANPLLQDVNKGWLQHLREFKGGAHVMKEVAAGSNKIQIGNGVGAANGYKNLDALVMDLISASIAPWYQDDTNLVVILGRDLLADKYFPLVNQAQPNTETLAADLIISQKRVGGKQAVTVPYFPANALAITRLDNLSIYFQEGARRRHLEENPKRNRIENYESSNDAYVIEDFDCMVAAENIQLV